MANKLDFPSPAELNQTYTENGITWVFDGVAWVDSGPAAGPAYVYSSDTPPSAPEDGDLWFDTSIGSCYVYYTDDDSSQWVVVSAAGAQGPTGPEGPEGPTGPTGPEGPEGPTGETGPEGPEGPSGVDGAGVEVMGSVATATSLDPSYSGSVGDMFIAQDTGNGHVWNGSAWDDVGPIQGPVGPAGPQGEQGIQGDAGTNGTNGTDGIQGPEGPEGPVGPVGPAGPEGPEGPEGPQGPQGTQGSYAYTVSGTVLTIDNDTNADYNVLGSVLYITTS